VLIVRRKPKFAATPPSLINLTWVAPTKIRPCFRTAFWHIRVTKWDNKPLITLQRRIYRFSGNIF
jgi:hypothetical protein